MAKDIGARGMDKVESNSIHMPFQTPVVIGGSCTALITFKA